MPKRHTIQAGESVESVAFDNGLFWETVWDFPANAELRKLREDPNILEEGDVLTVPDKRPKEEPGAANNRHRFLRKGVPSTLQVRLLDQDKPSASMGYTIRFGDKSVSGKSDGDGWVKCYLMPDVAEGTLTLETGEIYAFTIGTVRPHNSLRGVQNRLRNLGYYAGPIDGQMSEETAEALRSYQLKSGLPVTGESDDATRRALADMHQS
ncbi:MAG: peptidoglycan-binding domain-containing protein [Bryobacteraceae bacterium]